MYLGYLAVTVGVTVWVGRTLRKNGVVLLSENDQRSEGLTSAYAHLLTVGFYLLTLGVTSVLLKADTRPIDAESALETLASKVGIVLLGMGGLHFVIVAVLNARSQPKQHAVDKGYGYDR